MQDVANGTTPSEEKTPDPSNTDPENRDDVDKDVLSDEALEQLDRELEKVNPEEKQLEVSGTGVILNGTGDKETVAVVSYLTCCWSLISANVIVLMLI